jgi:hypothetical protein
MAEEEIVERGTGGMWKLFCCALVCCALAVPPTAHKAAITDTQVAPNDRRIETPHAVGLFDMSPLLDRLCR